MKHIRQYLPILQWAGDYSSAKLGADALAAVIVTIMLVPQSLAYAMIAGLPPEMGIYASIAPLLVYALFGTSSSLAVGPVAVVSLMTAAAVGEIASSGSAAYVEVALTLALLSGLMLIVFGVFRLGFLANFLSHPVISGFITAAAILIAASQMQHILGIDGGGHTLPEIVTQLMAAPAPSQWYTAIIGVAALAFLFWVRFSLKSLLLRFGASNTTSTVLVRLAPIVAIASAIAAVFYFKLADLGVDVVGVVPQSLPPLTIPSFSAALWGELLFAAALISLIGFVESISVAQTLAAKRRERIDPDQELIALGAANTAASFSGGFPVTGGFARSVVNYDAGAATPLAGALTAIGLGVVALTLTPVLFFLPRSVLAATIIVAVLSLVDLSILKRSWTYSKADFAAVIATIVLTLTLGVESGVATGVALSVAIHLYRSSRPHFAIVGRVPGTEHYRNIKRHAVLTDPGTLSIRVDESLYFANARFLEDLILKQVAENPKLKHVVLMCSAVNAIDMSALHSLEAINERLSLAGVLLHLSEVKGPVMDRLERSAFLDHLTGRVFLSQHDAACALAADQMASKTPVSEEREPSRTTKTEPEKELKA